MRILRFLLSLALIIRARISQRITPLCKLISDLLLYIDVICYSRDISTGRKTPTLADKDCKAAIPLSLDFALKSQKSKYCCLIIACSLQVLFSQDQIDFLPCSTKRFSRLFVVVDHNYFLSFMANCCIFFIVLRSLLNLLSLSWRDLL